MSARKVWQNFCRTFSFSFKIGHIWSVEGKAKQFCFAKENKPDWFDNNPYRAEEEKR